MINVIFCIILNFDIKYYYIKSFNFKIYIMNFHINLFVILIFNINKKLLSIKFNVINCWNYEHYEN
jgi:hypothetical protein